MRLAIVSPSNNAYSETFIQAHKEFIKAEKFNYYGGRIPTHLEGKGLLLGSTLLKRVFNIASNRIFNKGNITLVEEAFYTSLKKNKIDVVLAEYGLTGAAITPICKKLKIPLLVFFHGYDAYSKPILEQYSEKYNRMFNYARTIFVVSKDMYRRLREFGCPEDKLVLNVYGPNEIFFKVHSEQTKKNIVAVGRFVDKKAPYFTILAFRRVLEQHPDAHLFLAGEGALLNTCQNIVKYFNLSHNIHFIGIISPDQFRNYLSNSSVFVQHSITAANGDSEGTPVAILEAQAAGIPVVSTKHAGISDVVLEGKTGYLVEEGDADGMAEMISRLLSDLPRAKEMGDEAKSHIQKNFTLKAHISTIEKYL